jgi:hypothetical protein
MAQGGVQIDVFPLNVLQKYLEQRLALEAQGPQQAPLPLENLLGDLLEAAQLVTQGGVIG